MFSMESVIGVPVCAAPRLNASFHRRATVGPGEKVLESADEIGNRKKVGERFVHV